MAVAAATVAFAFWFRSARAAATAALMSGALLWLGPSSDPATRLIVIADPSAPELPGQLEKLETALGVRDCLVVLRDDEPAGHAPAWRSRCRVHEATHARTIDEALQNALQRFANRGVAAAVWDRLSGTQQRIALIPGKPRLGALEGHSIDAAALAARAREHGVLVDYAWSSTLESAVRPPQLSIRPHQHTVMALRNPGVEQLSFDLTLEGARSPGSVDVACMFAGSCLRDEDCGAAAPLCVEGHCTTECSSEADCPAGDGVYKTCTASRCSIASPASARAFEVSVRDPTVSGSATSLGRYDLSQFRFLSPSPASSIIPGFYPLTCRATYEDDGERRTVWSARYFLATDDGWTAVWGEGRGLMLPSETRDGDALRAVAFDTLIDAMGRTSLRYARDATEVALAPGKASLAALLRDDAPVRLLLVHDASHLFWKTRCAELLDYVRNGGNLVVSVAPPRIAGCELPAFASREDDAAFVDLKPRVTFLLDDSRLGRLTHRQASTASAALEDLADIRKRSLKDGLLELQIPILERIAGALHWDIVGDQLTPRRHGDAAAPLFTLEVVPPLAEAKGAGQGKGIVAMAAASAIPRRATRLPALERERIGVHDVVVVFAYDVRTSQPPESIIPDLLGRGARVIVVPVKTPFAQAVAAGGSSLHQLLARYRPPRDAPLSREPALLDRLEVATTAGVVPLRRWSPGSAALSVESDGIDDVVDGLTRHLDALYGPAALRLLRARRHHRFVRASLSGQPFGPDTVGGSGRGEPLRFQRLVQNAELAEDSALLFDIEWPSAVPATLSPMPLAYGGVVGQGHILVAGYSLLDGAGEPALSNPRLGPIARIHAQGRVDPLGLGLFVHLGETTDRLVPVPSDVPRVVGVEVRDRRFLELDVSLRTDERAPRLDSIHLVDAETCSDPTVSAGAKLSLVGLDPLSQIASFQLPPLQRARLCDGASCKVSLCRKACEGCAWQKGDAALYLEAASDEATTSLGDLTLDQQLHWLRSMSSGSDISPPAAAPRSFAVLSRLALLLAATLLFLAPAARRLRASVLARVQRSRRASTDPSHGLLRGTAEALGVPSPVVPAGAFAGYRPLEGGDPLRSVEPRDLVLSMQLRPGFLSSVPRVALRIDTSPRSLLVIVDGGATMRVGAGQPKLQAARRIVALLAETAASLNTSVTLATMAIADRSLQTGPYHGRIPTPELEAFFAAIARAAAVSSRAIELTDEPGVSIVLISDLMGVDLEDLRTTVARIQLGGSSIGVFVPWSRQEWLETHVGWLAGSRTLADRSYLDPRHLAVMHARRRERVLALLADAHGGVTAVGAEMSDAELLAAVVEGPVVEIMR
ncbi:hypothetical protein [Sorangium cellulosum]|uniref:VWFA domain-containing protein n=1 Tax=Sorangium cellulosum So0157-2 TaxID=1254432 RepID=S4XYC3_SORCE|nr:hypothetical protein [Sorangium cellulosum]AGP37454.1 hypothetical protein SCE1572_24955 [Sorangium cellulosum So0157-2]AKI82206.1 hypothetical protein [Sorangium cellulosum So0157-2]